MPRTVLKVCGGWVVVVVVDTYFSVQRKSRPSGTKWPLSHSQFCFGNNFLTSAYSSILLSMLIYIFPVLRVDTNIRPVFGYIKLCHNSHNSHFAILPIMTIRVLNMVLMCMWRIGKWICIGWNHDHFLYIFAIFRPKNEESLPMGPRSSSLCFWNQWIMENGNGYLANSKFNFFAPSPNVSTVKHQKKWRWP